MKKQTFKDKGELVHFLNKMIIETDFYTEPKRDDIRNAFLFSINYLYIALGNYEPFKNVSTFKKLIKLYKQVLEIDINKSNEILLERRKVLNDFQYLSDTDKSQIENELNKLSFRELAEIAILDNKYLCKVDGFNYNDLQPNEVYRLSYGSYLWVNLKNKYDLQTTNEFLKLEFSNDSNKKKADRLATKISIYFIEFSLTDGKKKETIERPNLETKSKNDALFMLKTNGKRTEKATNDFQLATLKTTENSTQYLIIANKDAESKKLLGELGRLEDENKKLDPNSDTYAENKKDIEEIKGEIDKLTENYIYYRNSYFLVDSEDYKTSLSLDIDGFYNFKNKEGQRIAILPPRIITMESKEYSQILNAILTRALKDAPNDIISVFNFSNSDIAEMMGLDPYEDYDILTISDKKRYTRAKQIFIDVVRFELEQITYDLPEYKGRFIQSEQIGKDYVKGIKITISKEYLNLLLNEGYGNYYNLACEDLKSVNAITMYKEICREVFINRNKNLPDEYNYKFSLMKLRKLGKYNSIEILKKTDLTAKQKEEKNKSIKDKIRKDLRLLADNGLIYISEIRGVSEFTIYPISETKDRRQQNKTFTELANANGHKLACINE